MKFDSENNKKLEDYELREDHHQGDQEGKLRDEQELKQGNTLSRTMVAQTLKQLSIEWQHRDESRSYTHWCHILIDAESLSLLLTYGTLWIYLNYFRLFVITLLLNLMF